MENYYLGQEGKIKINDLCDNFIFGSRFSPNENLFVNEEAINSLLGLREDTSDIKKYYIYLGRHLSIFKEKRLYCKLYYCDGEDEFYRCIKDNIGLEKTAISRCISVYKRFADPDGLLKEEYSSYNYSQLVEMVSMDEPNVITPDMTIKQIREKKKELKFSENAAAIKGEKIATSQTKDKKVKYKSICSNRKCLLGIIAERLKCIDYQYSNLFFNYNQEIDGKSIYIDVTKELKDFEKGRYKITLTKVKE